MNLLSNLILLADVSAATQQTGGLGGMLMSFLPLILIASLVCFAVINSKKKREKEERCDMPMKWYDFLVRFALVFGAILNVLMSFQYISGGIYLENDVIPEQVYAFYGYGLKTLDVCYGIILIAFAAFCIYTRQCLAKYKVNGPSCIIATNILSIFLPFTYNVISGVIASTALTEILSHSLGSVLATGIILFCNIKYFNRRKHLFTN